MIPYMFPRHMYTIFTINRQVFISNCEELFCSAQKTYNRHLGLCSTYLDLANYIGAVCLLKKACFSSVRVSVASLHIVVQESTEKISND